MQNKVLDGIGKAYGVNDSQDSQESIKAPKESFEVAFINIVITLQKEFSK